MNFLTLWLSLNLTPAIAAFVLGYAYIYCRCSLNKYALINGGIWFTYSFIVFLLPCLAITALVKYLS